MNQETTSPSYSTMLLTFLAGATVGAVVVALTTRKTGAELRGDIRELALSAKEKAGLMATEAYGAWDGIKDRTSLAASDIKRGFADAAKDLKA
jgi:gas vesicle protein